MKRKTTKKGFTIIETTLATMFLGVIVLSVANLIIQMTHIYQKSLALRAINSTGQQIVEDMQRKINSADYLYDLDTNHDGYLVNKEIIDNMSKYFREWNVGASNSATDQKQIAGAFCVSDYTYIWNSPIPLKEGDNKGILIKAKKTTGSGTETKQYKLARVFDPNHSVCENKWLSSDGGNTSDPNARTYTGDSYTIDMSSSDEPVVELVNSDESNLAIYDLTVHPIIQSTVTKQSFVSISFILATVRGDVNIMSDGDFCRGTGTEDLADTDYSSYDFEYCAVNKFDFSMRSGGNSNKRG